MAGVKIYLCDDGYYHAKTVNMDSEICSIGSCNMDIRCYNVNYELNSVVYSRAKAEERAAQFTRDLEKCRPFSLDEYNNSGVWPRLVDSTYRLASLLLEANTGRSGKIARTLYIPTPALVFSDLRKATLATKGKHNIRLHSTVVQKPCDAVTGYWSQS